ncbi:MAG: acetyl-CoA carboxylase biotin carboxylase subunit [Acidimicrobiia bacterium]|nr:MAG: acetyl-CoA carboxylase biotin carboxylase subunit [Acidimicrobiia bacterium]
MRSVLVANRGEIAVRVIRGVKELGLRAVAVYSEIDRDALHVRHADEAWNIGPAPAAESYLDIDAILRVAAESGADAVHPGYGFLAENAEFASRVIHAGLTWVGPPPAAITAMGDKIASRKVAEQAGVSGVPGTMEPLPDADAVRAVATRFGYPIAIKAAHGGGGKGMRVVRSAADLDEAFESARREADAYFKNPEVYVEKYLEHPRHVEAQIIFDKHGKGVFLGERDCSLQRRHQKLVEESPSTALDDKQRKALGKAALAVAKVAGYENAGTVEFLVDASGSFYFLEMNTRLQVEHTVTEMVTGIDLVKEQLRVAMGEPLSFGEISARGHAIEFRINAENPATGFLPSPGRIVDYRQPGGFGVRVDSGYEAGSAISQYYDNLVAKLVVWGRDRQEAIERSRRALDEYTITGVETTIPFHRLALDLPAFTAGTHHTRTVEEEMDLTAIRHPSPSQLPEDEELAERSMTVEVGGRRFVVKTWAPETLPATSTSGRRPAPRRRPPKLSQAPAAGNSAGAITAPMQGTIVKVHKKAGDRVEAGDPLFILEAMKMENEIRSPAGGEMVDLRVQPGDKVASGAVLAVVR